ncbi:hypothetical protein CP532_6300 [Ophiocordyceps camponoti-leonardi (nom. inval.)]|nr:hypothetical protein CP532_6300 [Ophiocordyceps camponoti-leonardi (nom. inval.)]
MQTPELTLIVAATRSMGIGSHGSLPWSGLRKEMQYFVRVTSKAPPGTSNAVIMGRKTWHSIPPQFRPLKNRLNIVISRSSPTPSEEPSATSSLPREEGAQPTRVPSMEEALRRARDAHRVFVIGGAQIYDLALRSGAARRVLLTSVERDFDCDTFFPISLPGAPGWVRRSDEDLGRWTGQDVDSVSQCEGDVEYEFQMWEAEE